METKQVPAKTFYCAEKTLTIPEIPQFAEQVLEPLYKKAAVLDLDIAGPPEFVYFNSSGDPKRPFHLVVGFPVADRKPSKGEFFFFETQPFHCAAVDYKGPMQGIRDAWKELVQEVLDKGFWPGNQGREVYKHWVSFESAENITELQMGIVGRKLP
jgi:predicted transcriptional regulator YdeE